MAAAEDEDVFAWFQQRLEAEGDVKETIKDVVKDIEQVARSLERVLSRCHHIPESQSADFLAEARQLCAGLPPLYAKLTAALPAGQYFRYNGMWRGTNQQICGRICMLVYLESGTMATLQDVQDTLQNQDPFHIELEDFLLGLCNVPAELARLATNAVTVGDLGRPLKLCQFVTDIYDGFRQLNLKNDGLRKKFDGLKYEVKKLEGVVYDLSIRGLVKAADDQAAMEE